MPMNMPIRLSAAVIVTAGLPGMAAYAHATAGADTAAFVPGPRRRLPSQPMPARALARLASASDGEGAGGVDPDPLDYFDPLRSPHEYPDGIDATVERAAGAFGGGARRGLEEVDAPEGGNRQQTTKQRPSPASFDDDTFDPFLLSPNDFGSPTPPSGPNAEDAYSKKIVGFTIDDDDADDGPPSRAAMPAAPQKETKAVPSSAPAQSEECDPGADPVLFDPRVSPHAYSGGIPECAEGDQAGAPHSALSSPDPRDQTQQREKVGVLLIDHGSKREGSNERLVKIAECYQERCPPHYVVGHAHMEIAEPSIEDGIRALLDSGASSVVCHPYFLSPGRHVTEDIPQLISEAMESIARPEVPLITTDPLGSNLDVMVNAIGTLVDDSARKMGGGAAQQQAEKDDYQLGGLFGDIQRMLNEQLD